MPRNHGSPWFQSGAKWISSIHSMGVSFFGADFLAVSPVKLPSKGSLQNRHTHIDPFMDLDSFIRNTAQKHISVNGEPPSIPLGVPLKPEQKKRRKTKTSLLHLVKLRAHLWVLRDLVNSARP